MAKNLLIGLGGTGSRIVNYVVADLKRKKIGINDGKICCVVMDTNYYEYLKDSGSGIPAIVTSKIRYLETYMDIYEKDGVGNWMPVSPWISRRHMSDGAAQMRSKSRLAFYDFIKSGAIAELEKEIEKLIDEKREKVTVNIVSSLAGGTGSGMLIQTAMWVRQFFESKNIPVTIRGILVLPDVFIRTIGQIGQDETECRVLRANAYAAIRELNAITKIKTKGYKPTSPIKIDEIGFNSDDVPDGQPVFNYVFFMDNVADDGSALKTIADYEKTVARIAYMQLFPPLFGDTNSMEDTIYKRFQIANDPRYGSCGTAKAQYPADSVLEYCSLRAAKEALSTDWRKIDQNIKAIIRSEKQNEDDGSERTDPRKVYIKQFEELSLIESGRDTLIYKIRNDIKNEKVEIQDEDRGTVELSDKVDDFLTKFYYKHLTKTIEKNDLGGLSKIKVEASWLTNENEASEIQQARDFVLDKRTTLESFIRSVKAKSNYLAKSIADDICPVDMCEVDRNNPNSMIGLFTKKDENGQLYFVHPIAIRYLLYRLLEEFENEMAVGGNLENDCDKISFNKKEQKYSQEVAVFDKVNTAEEEDALSFLDKKPFFTSKAKFLKRFKQLYVECNTNQFEACKSYAEKTIKYKVAVILAERIENLIKIVERFFEGLDNLSADIDDYIAKNVAETGDFSNKIYYVCASGEEKESLYNSLNFKTANSNVDVNWLVVNAFYAQLCVDENPEADYNKPYARIDITEKFKEKIVDTYGKIIREDYGHEIYMDLYAAVCKSSDLEYMRENGDVEEDSFLRNERRLKAMKDLIARVQSNSSPYLLVKDKVKSNLGQQVTFWGFSPELAKACPELGNILKVNVETQQNDAYDKHEIDCYFSVYGIPASDVDKFNEFRKRDRNNFYGSYEYIVGTMDEKVAGGDKEALVMTPHLDKTWHTILPFISY